MEKLIEKFINSFNHLDFNSLSDCLAENCQSYITNKNAGVFLLDGRKALVYATIHPI